MNGGNVISRRHAQHGQVEPDRVGAQPDVPVVEVAARPPRRQRRRVEEDDRDRRLHVVGHERDQQPDDRTATPPGVAAANASSGSRRLPRVSVTGSLYRCRVAARQRRPA